MIKLQWVLKYAITLLIFLVLLILAIAGSGFLLLGLNQIKDMKFDGDPVVSAVFIFCGIMYLIFVFMFILLILLFYQSFWRNRDLFGTSSLGRMIALGIVACIFPQSIYHFFVVPMRFIVILLTESTESLFSACFRSINSDIQQYDVLEFLRYFASTLQVMTIEIGRQLNQVFISLSIPNILTSLALFAFLGYFFSEASTGTNPSKNKTITGFSNTRIGNYFKFLPPSKLSNMLLLVIFLFSAYLCIAAIVTIPWLQEVELPDTLNKESLKNRLQEIVKQQQDFDSQYPSDLKPEEDLLSALSISIKNENTSINDSAPASDQLPKKSDLRAKNIGMIKEEIEKITQTRDSVHEKWKQNRADVYEKQKKLLNATINNFEAEMLSPMTTQERIVYFQNIIIWFKENIQDLNDRLTNAMALIEDFEREISDWAIHKKTEIEANYHSISSTDGSKESASLESLGYREFDYYPQFSDTISFKLNYMKNNLVSQFRLLENTSMQPSPPDPGLGWGPFGWISKWLLKTKSFAIVLIAGMLGFGLFGSATSSFIRERFDHTQNQPYVKDIVSVMIKGISAAVVIFLAVEGGLAVFVHGEMKVNAYVLFFTCLVGAVFSEDVWIWARKRLIKSLSDEADKKAGIN